MTRYIIATAAAAALALAGCSQSTDDTVTNEPATDVANIDSMADSAASDASNAANAEAEALGNQEAQLENENAAAAATNPTDSDEQNVSGM